MTLFDRISVGVSNWFGRPTALLLAVLYVMYLLVTGRLDFNDPVLIISILTWWQLFPIQASQNRDIRALQMKMDEMIRVTRKASNDLIGIEKKK